uniref:Ycf54 n=1 Tax=Nitophyllum punctatum TaxID=158729 RepID=A0A4D6WVL9_9FLOR|nr:hypothetical protein [Nitophyllum punctatum]
MYDYYFAVASQHFLLNEEPLEEVLRERTQYYKNQNKDIDFWFILNPSFLQPNDLKDQCSDILNLPHAAIISLDKQFIQWLKLRIGFIAVGNFQSESIFIPSM